MSGNLLEKSVNKANLNYRKLGLAVIMKVPVPILYTATGLIADRSTVDYTGVIEKGLHIAFDAKECGSKTSFPLSNIKEHQILYLELTQKLTGISFFMIHFTKLDKEVYITPLQLIIDYANGSKKRKSIPIKEFKPEWKVDVNNYLTKVKELENVLRNIK